MTDTFVLNLSPDAAWYIRSVVRPGMEIDWPGDSPGKAADVTLRGLRQKVNHAILQFVDHKEKEVNIDCTEAEAWLIDSAVSSDGGGVATDLLLQLFRGMRYLDMRKDGSEL